MWIMLDFAYTEQLNFVPGHLCKVASNTETVLFTMFLAFVFYWHKAEECNITWPITHQRYRCTFWTSCTGVSWKRPFVFILRNFWYNWLTEMRILVGQVRHTGMESTLKMKRVFWFSFCQGYKSRHYSAGGTTLHVPWTLQYTRLSCAHSGQFTLFCA